MNQVKAIKTIKSVKSVKLVSPTRKDTVTAFTVVTDFIGFTS